MNRNKILARVLVKLSMDRYPYLPKHKKVPEGDSDKYFNFQVQQLEKRIDEAEKLKKDMSQTLNDLKREKINPEDVDIEKLVIPKLEIKTKR